VNDAAETRNPMGNYLILTRTGTVVTGQSPHGPHLSLDKAAFTEEREVLRSLSVEPIPREALFLAGKAFVRYRRRKRCEAGRFAGLLYWSPCGRQWAYHFDTRRFEISQLFSNSCADRSIMRGSHGLMTWSERGD